MHGTGRPVKNFPSAARHGRMWASDGGKGMVICERLRASREEKDLPQADLEKRTGLLRFYILRVENADTVPPVEGPGNLRSFAYKLA